MQTRTSPPFHSPTLTHTFTSWSHHSPAKSYLPYWYHRKRTCRHRCCACFGLTFSRLATIRFLTSPTNTSQAFLHGLAFHLLLVPNHTHLTPLFPHLCLHPTNPGSPPTLHPPSRHISLTHVLTSLTALPKLTVTSPITTSNLITTSHIHVIIIIFGTLANGRSLRNFYKSVVVPSRQLLELPPFPSPIT